MTTTLRKLCEACEANAHHECDGNRWDESNEDWADCRCIDEYHDA